MKEDWLDRRMLWIISGAIGERELGHFWEEINPLDGLVCLVWFIRAIWRQRQVEVRKK